MRRGILATTLLAEVLVGTHLAAAQKVGDKVVVIHDSIEVKARNEVVDKVGRGQIFVVREVLGTRLEISNGTPGFIEKRHVIPFDQAIGHWSGIIRANAKDAGAYWARAAAWRELEDADKAIQDYNECLRIDPKNYGAYEWRGVAWHGKGNYENAIADYNEAIRLMTSLGASDVRRAGTYRIRGVAWKAKQEYDKAIADYNEAIRLDPRNCNSYSNRAWLWATCPEARVRDGAKAVESATRSCELDGWKNPIILDTLAAAYAEAGDFVAAVNWQTKATEMAPESDKTKFRSRLALYQQGVPYRDTPK